MSDPSRDLTLLVELPPLAEGGDKGQLLIQECERPGGKKKLVGLATFVPRCRGGGGPAAFFLIGLQMLPPRLLSPPSLPPVAKCTFLPLQSAPLPHHSIHSPSLVLLSTHCRLPDLAKSAAAAHLELVFVVDGSGSMDGSPIQQAGP